MDENFTQSAACSGECSTCGSDCGIDVSQPTVTLTLDDDTEVVCAVLTIFPAPNGEVYLYRYSETEEGQPSLANIEEDEEYHIAADAFDEMLDSMQFDGEDEEEG